MEIFLSNIKHISNITPCKHGFFSKMGNFTASGFINKTKVKISSYTDIKQVDLLVFLESSILSNYFPKILETHKNLVVTEWIHGTTLQEEYKNLKKIKHADEIKNIILKLSDISYPYPVFDYLSYIHSRVNQQITVNTESLPNRVNHNDLNLSNIVVNKTGIKIIDNELLGNNTGWVLNLKNSFLSDDSSFYNNFIKTEDVNTLWKIRKKYNEINK